MPTALFDTNIILDVLFSREPWAKESRALWDACDRGQLHGYVSAVSLTNVFYIGRKFFGRERAHEAIGTCLSAFSVCMVDRRTLDAAWRMPGGDFEDNVQIACASVKALDFIVTRDLHGFIHSMVAELKPADLLAHLIPG
jgi:predicted nucleic acid-binding protein